MAKLILGIGIPGAGKTTALKNFANKHNYAYISADEVRKSLNISPEDPRVASDNALTQNMWDEIRRLTATSLKGGKTVVLDATFARLDLRREFIELAKQNGAHKVQGVFVDTPTETAWERVTGRENGHRKDDEHVITRDVFDKRVQDLKNDPPILEDGFDTVFTLDEYEKLHTSELAKRNGNNELLARTIRRI